MSEQRPSRSWKPNEHYTVTITDPEGAVLFVGKILLQEGDALSIVGDKAVVRATRAIHAATAEKGFS